jgi:hypothetical protein
MVKFSAASDGKLVSAGDQYISAQGAAYHRGVQQRGGVGHVNVIHHPSGGRE